MSGIREATFGRLNQTALDSLEAATVLCQQRGNPYVEAAHWLRALIRDPSNDVAAICARFGVDLDVLARDLDAVLDRLPRGATAISDFSPLLQEMAERGWLFASLQFSVARVRTGHLVYGMLKTPSLRNAVLGLSREWRRIAPDALAEEFDAIAAASRESNEIRPLADAARPAEAKGETSALEAYSVDLTAKARSGEIDVIVGRDAEIRQVVDILMRRRQNNPILTGEAGVGKTAVVEGFARRIVDGDVPPTLKDVSLRALDIGLLQAGASMRGEFEKRLRQVIDEIESSPAPIVLFIDEAHTLIGAGGQTGTGDAANLLKPALARGRLRTIAATTWSEYRQYIEKDPALTRRFQTVAVGEPETEDAVAMLRSLVPAMEKHHGIVVLDAAVAAAVGLSRRYVPARQLPDKAVSLLDTACARVAISQHAMPAPVEDRTRKVQLLDTELAIARREAENRFGDPARVAQLESERVAAVSARDAATAQWKAEAEALAQVRSAREAVAVGTPGADTALEAALTAQRAVQGEAPMVFGEVDQDAVAAVVADWTGIPVGRMVKDEIAAVLSIGDRLKARVVGQDHALDAIARRIQTSRAGLDNPGKPVGVFMLCGPSGVGKTETAHALAELLYSGDDSLIVINMSEFQEAHTVSTLKGAPAGYVGYGQGGVLTEAVRRRPYSVVLLDEVEKAHPDVHEMFFQVFDKGYMDDAEGRHIDFRNTLILLTSNVGTAQIAALSADADRKPEPETLGRALRPDLLDVFPAALLGRLVVLPYYPLSADMLRRIVRLQLDRIVARVAENHAIAMHYDEAVVDLVVSRCHEVESGGRVIDAILTNTMLPEISVALLERRMRGEAVTEIGVGVDGANFTYSYL